MKKLVVAVSAVTCMNAGAQELEEILVRAHPLSGNGLSQSTDVLSGDELAEELQSSLGETLATLPGVRSASFGGAVGRPVIHGMGGARIKTTEDRIDSLDVSVTSTDHAVTVEPFIANQITILKGASTLLYGAGAIGGVVDTETGRIPVELPGEPVQGRVELRLGDNADAETGAVRLDGQLGSNFAWHVDAFSKSADDYEIAGEVESAAQRAAEALAGEEEDEEESETGVLEGSYYDVEGGAFGASWIGEAGFIGVSVSSLDAEYGLVGGHGHEHEDEHDEEHDEEEHDEEEHDEEHEEGEEEPGFIDLEQTRVDLEAQLNNPFAGVEKINLRVGINDYEHLEVEGSGEAGTLFDNDAWEGRLEITHTPLLGFDGAFGVQLSEREFSALGEEAFVPPVETETAGLFWVGQRNLEAVSIELGARFDSVDHTPVEAGLPDTDFSTFSTSLGAVWPVNEQITWSALIDYSERAPGIEELYSNGPHLATQSFEIGSTELDKESGIGLSLAWSYQSELFDANVSVYYTDFSDYIYQADTGTEEDDLPVLIYLQDDATFTGLDLELGLHLFELAGGDLDLTAQFDVVSAELSNQGDESLPRIPADRIGLGLAWKNEYWRARLNFSHVSSQTDVAAFELPTESYDDISARVSRRFQLGENALEVFVAGRNLGDDEQREHASFVKDFAPAPGRQVELGVRLQF